MKDFFFCILLLFISANLSFAIEGAEIAVYSDNGVGTWEDGIIAFEQFLKWKGITSERISPLDINTVKLKDYYKAIYFPGGDADYYNAAINQNGIQHIKELVSTGGGYIGMCAGAEFACDRFIWDNVEYDYPLDLFIGKAVGPIDVIAPWPGYTMTTLNMNNDNPINRFEPDSEIMLYYGGSAMYPDSSTIIDTVASWDAYNNHNAIINFNYGDGRVLLIAPHPEIEEDSDRDSTDVAEELDDANSDWPFLWSAVDWLLGDPITSLSTSSTFDKSQSNISNAVFHIENYPNPFNPVTTISFNLPKAQQVTITVYALNGREITTLSNQGYSAGSHSVEWNATDYSSGIYIYRLIAGSFTTTGKLLLVK